MTVSQIQKIERMKLMKKKMKKIVSILCMMSLLFSMLTVKVNASNDDIKVLVDGTELTFDVPPQIIDDYTMVPMRGIFEALGYDVVWDEENKQIVANRNSQFIIMTLDEKAYLNITGGVKDMSKTDIQKYYGKILDVKPQLVNGRTLVPLRAIAEDSGCVVKWNNNTRTITIDSSFIPFDKKYSKIPIYAGDDNSNGYIVHNYIFKASDCTQKEIDEYKTYLNIIGFKYNKTIDDDEEKSDVYINNDNVMVLIGYSNKNNEDYKKMYGEQVVFFDIHVPQNIQFNISTQDTQSDEQTTENEIISFDDISANINQIKSYIDSGMYLEAIQECEKTEKEHKISQEDIDLIGELKNDAQWRYNEYIKQEKENNKNKEVTDSQKREMFDTIKSYVSSSLRSPSTAIWPDYTKTSYFYLENGHIVAVGHLEAMNGFGGYGKVPYYFEFNEDLTVNWWN